MSDIAATAEAIEEKPQPTDYEAAIKDLTALADDQRDLIRKYIAAAVENEHRAETAEQALKAAEAIIAERHPFDGPAYAGLCQFRAADGRVCLTIAADGRMERGPAFPSDDAAQAAFFESMARNFKGHLHDRENRMIAAEAEIAVQRQRADEVAGINTLLRQQAEKVAGEFLQLRHQVAVAEAKATALLEALKRD